MFLFLDFCGSLKRVFVFFRSFSCFVLRCCFFKVIFRCWTFLAGSFCIALIESYCFQSSPFGFCFGPTNVLRFPLCLSLSLSLGLRVSHSCSHSHPLSLSSTHTHIDALTSGVLHSASGGFIIHRNSPPTLNFRNLHWKETWISNRLNTILLS